MRTRLRWLAAGLGAVAMITTLTVGAAVLADPSDEASHPPHADGRNTGLDTQNCHERENLPDGISCGEVANAAALARAIDWDRAVDGLNWQNLEANIEADRQAALARSSGSGTSWCNEAGIIARESGGDPTVYNTSGSGASGLYQFMPGTWDNYMGYPNAADAPPEVQQQKFNEVWAGGAGSSHWSC